MNDFLFPFVNDFLFPFVVGLVIGFVIIANYDFLRMIITNNLRVSFLGFLAGLAITALLFVVI